MPALACPDCQTPFAAAEVNLGTGLARCLSCGTAHMVGPTKANLAPVRPATACPRTITEHVSGATLTLQAAWQQPAMWFLLLFCIVWDSILVMWYSTALLAFTGALGEPTAGPDEAGVGMMLFFPLLHVACGVGLTFYTAALFLNKTTIEVDRATLAVKHGPLYWPGACAVPSANIEQLYVAERIGNKGSRSYRLLAIVNGTAVQLSTQHPNKDYMRYLEERIERHLDLRDRRVSGEVM